MPTDITVTELQESVTVTGGTTSITVSGDTATVNVATTTQAVSVVDETNAFTINTVANKSDIGLGNVDNTSDLDKPISNPTKLYVDTEIDNLTTADIEEAGNLYYTQARADARVAAGIATIDYPVDSVNGKTNTVVLTTSDISEGTNQYFTTARARSSISGTGSIAYNSTTGVISYTGGANPVTTDELPEGTTNLYYTSTRANSDFDTRLATKTTTNLNEGTNLYYTSSRANSDFDTRLATKSTTNLAEGTNLYYTTARSNTDFDARLATKTTTNLAEGTNLYYTDARARSAISGSTGITYDNITGVVAVDSTIATKTYADNAATSAANSAVAALVDSAPATLDTLNELAAALGDDANFATTVTNALGQKLNTADFETAFDGHLAEKTTDDLTQGLINKYYASSLFNSDFATKTTTDLTEGTNLYYTTARFDTRFATKTTDNLNEGTTNQYFTNARARQAITVSDTGGDGSLSYDNSTGVVTYTGPSASEVRAHFSSGTGVTITDGVVAIGQSVATTASPTFAGVSAGNISVGVATDNTIASTNTNGDIVLDPNGTGRIILDGIQRLRGESQATTNNSYVFPTATLTTITDNNGYSAVSSFEPGTFGYGANAAYTHYYGDTLSAQNSAPALNYRAAEGNSVTGVNLPWTGTNSVAPSALLSGTVLGTTNFNGYATTGFTNDIATQYQGGGTGTSHVIQYQGYAAENLADGTLIITSANITGISSFRVALINPAVTGTKGQISFNTVTVGIGQAIRVTGTLTGTATGIVSGQSYYIIGTTGTTGATLSATPGGPPITTTAGTLTGLTLIRCGVTLTLSGQTSYPFGRNALVTVSGITNVTNGTYPVGGIINSLTTLVLGIPHSVAPALSGTQQLSCPTVTNAAGGVRIRAVPVGVPLNPQNRLNIVDHTAANCTLRADTFNLNTGAYANTGVGVTGNNIIYNRVFGQWQNTTTITPAAANTAAVFALPTTDFANIASVGSTSRIIPGALGFYKTQFSVQVLNTDNASEHTAYFWWRKNGVDVTGSMGRVVIPRGAVGGELIVGWDNMVQVTATTDYWELAYAVEDTQITFPSYTATAFGPGTSALFVTLVPIGA